MIFQGNFIFYLILLKNGRVDNERVGFSKVCENNFFMESGIL